MHDGDRAPRDQVTVRRSVGLAARIGALTLSVSVVGALMFRAGGLGCSSTDATKDSSRSAVDAAATQSGASMTSDAATPATSTGAAATASPSASGFRKGEGGYFGGSKAMVLPNGLLRPAPSASSPQPRPSQPPANGEHFPGTKSGLPFKGSPNAPDQPQ